MRRKGAHKSPGKPAPARQTARGGSGGVAQRRRRGSILNFEAMTDAMNILACARFAMVRRGCREVVAGEGWRSEQDGKQGRMLHWATGKQSVSRVHGSEGRSRRPQLCSRHAPSPRFLQDLDFDAANKASLIRTTRVARITAKEDEENRKLMHEHLKLCKWPEILRLLEDGVTVEAETPDVRASRAPPLRCGVVPRR